MERMTLFPLFLLYFRATRLPFLLISILPFVFGSCIPGEDFKIVRFVLGLFSVMTTHLGANLMNDYGDALSGVDAFDKKYYGLFGGSKLIQEERLSAPCYFQLAVVCFGLAAVSVLGLAYVLRSPLTLILFAVIVFLSLAYSIKPWQLCYHRMGEILIFILFGPALVMGGIFIQTLQFPTLQGFLLSLPFGFLNTAILFANEIPDFENDCKGGKLTWVGFFGANKAYKFYMFLVTAGFASVFLNFIRGDLSLFSLGSFLLLILAYQAMTIQRQDSSDKEKLLVSSKLTIDITLCLGIVLILDKIFF